MRVEILQLLRGNGGRERRQCVDKPTQESEYTYRLQSITVVILPNRLQHSQNFVVQG